MSLIGNVKMASIRVFSITFVAGWWQQSNVSETSAEQFGEDTEIKLHSYNAMLLSHCITSSSGFGDKYLEVLHKEV